MAETSVFLLVEDEKDDAALIQRAFRRAKLLNPLQIVRSGEEAMMYLKGEGRYSNREEFPLPALVLLDLRMHGMDGFELLGWIRSQENLRALRVVVLSGSDAMTDVNRAYHLGANSFLVKPVDFERFVEISQALSGFWMWMSSAPTVERAPEEQTEHDHALETRRPRFDGF